MTDIPFPLISTPGQQPHVAGGRLINCYPEPLPKSAGKPFAYWRVPGLTTWGTAPGDRYRGGVVSQGNFYGLFGSTVYKFPLGGGAGVAMPGAISGSSFCWFAVNQNVPPDIAVVAPGVGAFVVTDPGGVANYPDPDVGAPNNVCFIGGYFVFTALSGFTIVSDLNSTNVNPINFATAQSKADVLWRPIPLTNGQLLLCGANTIEIWGSPINPQGYPYTYIATTYRGIVGPQAIAGIEDGWGKGIFFVGDDNKVSTFDASSTSYTPTPISVPDLDQLIEAEPDKTKIIVGVYTSRGHGFVLVQGPSWCWEYDTTQQSWHERQSYLATSWRGFQPIYVGGSWICGDNLSSSLLKLDGTVRKEVGNPLKMRIETGPAGAFPQAVRINGIELYMTKGASIAGGHDPDETNARVEIAMSKDGGFSWSNARSVPIGAQSVGNLRSRAAIWGQANVQGVRWRFDESAGLPFAMMGCDMQFDILR